MKSLTFLVEKKYWALIGWLIFAVINTVFFAALIIHFNPHITAWMAQRSFFKMQKQLELKTTPFSLMVIEHTNLEFLATHAVLNQTADSSVTEQKLIEQSRTLSVYVGSLYGSEKEAEFFEIMKKYDGALIQYAESARTHDSATRAAALSALSGYPVQISRFYAGLSKHVSHDVVLYAMNDYVAVLKTAIDMSAVADFSGALQQRKKAIDEMSVTATMLEKQLEDKE